ncbi:hypothetical protein [Mycoplasma sp. SG1]|uniref:hypothetical protein n=1 Tax=Mycoplasma sp. SG1 TaxID=2810348 RepID=UPI00202552F9|nr:hypothetical protein [Mycoplasma sp. SG1]URM53078.1 hypothetical protein JRW51_01890 [Mycoplasma sp. SG1]
MFRFNYLRWSFRFYFFSFANWLNIGFICFVVLLFSIPSTSFWYTHQFYNPTTSSNIDNFKIFDNFFASFFNNIFPISLMLLIFLVIIMNISYVYEFKKSSTVDIVVSSVGKLYHYIIILFISFSFLIFYSLVFFLLAGIIMSIFIGQFSPFSIFLFITQLKLHSFLETYNFLYQYTPEQFCYLPFNTVIGFTIILLLLNGAIYILLTTGLTAISESFFDIFLFVILILIVPIVFKNLINLLYNNLATKNISQNKNIIYTIFTIIPILSNGYFPVYLVIYKSQLGPDVLWPIFLSIGLCALTNILLFFLMKRFYYYGIFSFSKAHIWKKIRGIFSVKGLEQMKNQT